MEFNFLQFYMMIINCAQKGLLRSQDNYDYSVFQLQPGSLGIMDTIDGSGQKIYHVDIYGGSLRIGNFDRLPYEEAWSYTHFRRVATGSILM